MITPTGPDLASNLAAIQAGLCLYDQSPYLDQRGLPIKMALVPPDALDELSPALTLRRYLPWHKHLLRLASTAAVQAMQGYAGKQNIPIIINFAESEDTGAEIPQDFVNKLNEQCQGRISTERQRILLRGRAGGVEALALAEKLLFERDFDEILIGAVDSYQDSKRLLALENQQRLAGLGVPDGFTPGEGATFLRLTKNPAHSVFGPSHLRGPEIAFEPGHCYSEEPYLGEGLSLAVSGCLSRSEPGSIKQVHLTANGERYWAKETSVALIRHQEHVAEAAAVHHPAEFMGDLGAAMGTSLMALAAAQQASTDNQLICCSSDRGLRGSVLVSSSAPASQQEPEQLTQAAIN